jgi:hypothetical protein
VVTTPATTTDLGPPRSIAVHWVKNSMLAAILGIVASVLLFGIRQATGAADGTAGFAGTLTLYVAAVGIWAFWGAAGAVLTGAVLQRLLPALPVWTWIALHVVGSMIVGVGLEMIVTAAPRDAEAAGDSSMLAPFLSGLILGAILGAVTGGCEALVLRRAASGTGAWVICSILAYAISWAFTLVIAKWWDIGTDLSGELAGDAVGLAGSMAMALIMLPALQRLKSTMLSRAAEHFS